MKNENSNGACTNVYSRKEPDLEKISPHAETVHVDGYLTPRAVEAIRGRASCVRRIELIPWAMRNVGKEARALCQQCNIEIITGHAKPQLSWKENRSPWFKRKQSFLLHLQGEMKERWGELLSLKVPVALFTARYFCLQGEEYRPQDELAPDYGFSQGSYCINGVIHYLNPLEDVGATAKEVAQAIHRLVEKLQRKNSLNPFLETRTRVEQEFGVAMIPTNIDLRYIGDLDIALRARKDGRLDLLKVEDLNAYRALVWRFGLDETPPSYRTYEEIGECMGGKSRQNSLYHVQRALKKLKALSS